MQLDKTQRNRLVKQLNYILEQTKNNQLTWNQTAESLDARTRQSVDAYQADLPVTLWYPDSGLAENSFMSATLHLTMGNGNPSHTLILIRRKANGVETSEYLADSGLYSEEYRELASLFINLGSAVVDQLEAPTRVNEALNFLENNIEKSTPKSKGIGFQVG